MKKGKILVVGLIALLMAGGLVLAGCEDGSSTSGGGGDGGGGGSAACNNNNKCYNNDKGSSVCSKNSCWIHQNPLKYGTCDC